MSAHPSSGRRPPKGVSFPDEETGAHHRPVLAANPYVDETISAPALLPDESETAFFDFYMRLRHALQPRDVLEELFLSDFVACGWEMLRYRRWKAKLLRSYTPEELGRLLVGVVEDVKERKQLTAAWAVGEPAAVKRVAALLTQAGLDLDTAVARAFVAHLGEHEAIERLLAGAEKRRNEALRQAESRRAWRERLAAARKLEEAEIAAILADPT